ncbi:MAG: hypothetical protein IPM31_11225 [Anaerolineae bacterium]|nr:hypothetical protein [Anaerolineae bacterium]MBL8104006.1 hypothetical protein [Anaerolineales bacterium]MCC7190771.1 hypothetical protein [Anaerolineales bacterium]
MKHSTCLILFLVAIQTLLSSCTNASNPPPLSFEDAYLNQQVLLRVSSYSNTYKTRDPINLELKYNSDQEIIFPYDYNLKIFERSDEMWVELKEKPTYRFPLSDIVLSPPIEMPAVQVVVFFPDLQNPFRKYYIRIYVIGNMKTNNGIKEVAAYTEITLQP